MVFETNQVAGTGIIILNIIPFLLRRPKYLLITALLSLIILFLLLKQ
ncbi:hypothetical protein HZA96_04915 [Candidatus Woesearchaeota archaeon]|nr:hypothetical protein [Candidatus Woesearchaeota archaeon]